MMYNRTLRSRLHQISPIDKRKTEDLQIEKQQKLLESKTLPDRVFHTGQPVWVQLNDSKNWTEAKIVNSADSSNVYEVECNGRIVSKHADHLKKRIHPVIQLESGKYSESLDVSKFKYKHNTTPTVDQGAHSMFVPRVVQSSGTELPAEQLETADSGGSSVPQRTRVLNAPPSARSCPTTDTVGPVEPPLPSTSAESEVTRPNIELRRSSRLMEKAALKQSKQL